MKHNARWTVTLGQSEVQNRARLERRILVALLCDFCEFSMDKRMNFKNNYGLSEGAATFSIIIFPPVLDWASLSTCDTVKRPSDLEGSARPDFAYAGLGLSLYLQID